MQIDFVEPWVVVGSEKASLEAGLRRELLLDNLLSGLNLSAIGQRLDCDDVVFEILSEDANFKLALLHLTWSSVVESNPWLLMKLFANAEEFVAQMLIDVRDYN